MLACLWIAGCDWILCVNKRWHFHLQRATTVTHREFEMILKKLRQYFFRFLSGDVECLFVNIKRKSSLSSVSSNSSKHPGGLSQNISKLAVDKRRHTLVCWKGDNKKHSGLPPHSAWQNKENVIFMCVCCGWEAHFTQCQSWRCVKMTHFVICQSKENLKLQLCV